MREALEAVRGFVEVHPLVVVVVGLGVMLVLKLLCEPLPPEEQRGDGLPEDWPWRGRR